MALKKYFSINHRSIWSPNLTAKLVQAQKLKWSFFQSFFSQQRINSGSEWVRERRFNDLDGITTFTINFFDDFRCICYANVLFVSFIVWYTSPLFRMHPKILENICSLQQLNASLPLKKRANVSQKESYNGLKPHLSNSSSVSMAWNKHQISFF